jgi:hypothetical protein
MPTSTLSGEAEWPQVAGAVIEAGLQKWTHTFANEPQERPLKVQ